MPSVNVNIPAEIIVKLDKERKWINRSKAVTAVLEYVLRTEGAVTNLCGANCIPESYLVQVPNAQ